MTRSDDFAWFNIVKWVNFALVNAEELGIASENAAEATASRKPAVRRFVGVEGGLGKMLGLEDDWRCAPFGPPATIPRSTSGTWASSRGSGFRAD